MWWAAKYGTSLASEWIAFDDQAEADAWQLNNSSGVVWEAPAPEEWARGDAA